MTKQTAMDPEIPTFTMKPSHGQEPHRPRPNLPWRYLVIGFVALLLVIIGLSNRRKPEAEVVEAIATPQSYVAEEIVIALPPPLPPWPMFSHPTPQRNWHETENPKVYQPTGSGRLISASYGSVRTNSSGRASFHEGVDIAPIEKDRRGHAMDEVFSVSDGKVVYISRRAGNSSYGKYVVIAHQDDVGEVFTLYAHLASVPSNIKVGQTVKMGDTIAIMGHTSTLGIPVQRSHLHFEMGMMLNPSFSNWYKKNTQSALSHGKYHGWNFVGFNPHLMLQQLSGKDQIPFSYKHVLSEKVPAWHLIHKSTKQPRYFEMYPSLWTGAPYQGQAMVLSLSESGIPLSGRNATSEELAELGNQKSKVMDVNSDVLGRNGLRHIVKSRGNWILGSNGTRWLEILMYDAR